MNDHQKPQIVWGYFRELLTTIQGLAITLRVSTARGISMKSTKQATPRSSFFGGPLSTRAKCKAALESYKSDETPRKAPLLSTGRRESVTKQVGRRQTPSAVQRGNGTRAELPRNRIGPPGSRLKPKASGTLTAPGTPLPQKRAGRPALKAARGSEGIRRAPVTGAAKKKPVVVPTTGVKRKKENSEKKPVRQSDVPKRARHEGFFEIERRKIQRALPNQNRRPFRQPLVVDEMKDFIDSDDGDEGEDWRAELRKTTNYNPTKFNDDCYDDKSMESSLQQVWKEERRSQHLGRLEDQRELQRELKRKGVKDS